MGRPGVLVFLAMFTPRAFVPQARRRGVVSQEVDGETLLYVEETHQASSLNGPASRIWTLCDGKRGVETIAAEADLAPAVVVTALKQLWDAGLLENGGELHAINHSRRALVGLGLAGPVILMVIAPLAKAAATQCLASGTPCVSGTQCCAPHVCIPDVNVCE